MSYSSNNGLLVVPNLHPQRPAVDRADSLDDVSKLAPELSREHLTVEPSAFATGAFSDVFGGRWAPPEHPDGVDVAVKVLRISGQSTDPGPASENKRYGKHLGREIFVWQRVMHPRITPLIGYIREYKDGVVPCIITERRQGNLLEYLAKNPQADRLKLICQAVEGLIHLHTFKPNPIIHLDIKPSNILVTDEGDAELCDFGYAKVLGGASTGFTTSPNPGGTYPYMSPEVFNGEEWQDLTPGADIFAMGSTILYMLSGKRAWDSIKAKGPLMMKVLNGIPPARNEYPMDGSQEAIDSLWELLVPCWSQDAAKRPSAEEVLNKLRAIEAIGGVRPLTQESVAPKDTTG